MKCYYHSDLDSVSTCSVCTKSLCSSCSHKIKGKVYCQDCLISGTELAAVVGSSQLRNYSPARAAFFALIPGMGAVYNRQYAKAVIHFAIFAGLTILADEGLDIFVLGAIAFYIFMIVDAYRSARATLRYQVAHPESLQEESGEMNLPIWGGVLIAMGVLFFLNNLGVLSLREIARFVWPLVFVFLGFYFILDYYLRHQRVKTVPPARDSEKTEISQAEESR